MHKSTTRYYVEIYCKSGYWTMEHGAPFIERQRAEEHYEYLLETFPNSKFRLMHRYTMDSLIETNMEIEEEDTAF